MKLPLAGHHARKGKSGMLSVIATMRIKQGCEPAFERLFGELAAQVRANEPGNIHYDLFRVKDEPGTYKVIELYEDQAALEAHRQNAGLQALIPQLAELRAEPTRAEYYESV